MTKISKLLAAMVVIIMALGIIMPSSLLATDRYSGNDRYATAAETSKSGWASGADVVVLARGDFYADALAGVTLAFANDAPILLTRPNQLPKVTKDELTRLGATRVLILGGTAAVSQAVEDEVAAMGIDVTRISGDNRYATATAIAEELGWGSGSVFVVSGENFPDALSAAAYAAQLGSPILLTKANELPQETSAFLKEQNPGTIYVIGGSAAIGGRVFDQLTNAQRIKGADRYGTAVALAQQFGANLRNVFIASGLDSFGGADALTGAALAAQMGTGILLVGDQLPDAVADYLAGIHGVVVLGGSAAIPPGLEDDIEDALYTPSPGPIPGPGPGSGPDPGEDEPEADISFTAPAGLVAGGDDVSGFAVTVKNVANIADDVPIRYLMKVTAGSLDGKMIGYGYGDDTFTIKGNEAFFGPESGFTLADLPALKGDPGVTTPLTVKSGLAAGTYKFTVSIIKVGGEVLIASDEFQFTVADTDWFGDGSAEEFSIDNAEDLLGFANIVNGGTDFNGKTVKLGNNVDLTGYDWTPIGTATNKFTGTFDGQEHTISNLSVNTPAEKGVGLFGYVAKSGQLKNLTIDGATITGVESVGALAGHVFVGTVENVHVKDVTIQSTHWAGGLIGYAYADVTNCSAERVTVRLVFDTSKNDNGDKAGGLIGFLGENENVANCSVSDVNISGVRDVGGLLGNACAGTSFSNCHVTNGAVAALDSLGGTDSNPWAGGVIGRASGKGVTLAGCSVTGIEVSSYVDGKAGAIVGGPEGNYSVED